MESSIAVFLSRQPACERLLLNQTKRRYAPWTASRDIAHNAVVHRYRHLDPAHGTHTGRTSISDVLHEHTHTHTHTHTRTHARTHALRRGTAEQNGAKRGCAKCARVVRCGRAATLRSQSAKCARITKESLCKTGCQTTTRRMRDTLRTSRQQRKPTELR